MIETQKYIAAREEVKVEFTGLAHDHLMASSRIQSVKANTLHHHHLNANLQQQQQQQQQPQQGQQLVGTQNGPPPPQQQTTFGRLSSIQHKTNIIQQQPVPAEPVPPQSFKHNGSKVAEVVNNASASALSTIAILRRQTMYDSLVLVKKFRPCLNGYTLEFPTSYVVDDNNAPDAARDNKSIENQANECPMRDLDFGCGRTKLVSVYLDGDDPMYQSQRGATQACNGFGGKSEGNDIVYVPINGLLDRLDNYDRHGISIDSRVYAFAMGLKTAERFLTSSSEKEIQEAPPL